MRKSSGGIRANGRFAFILFAFFAAFALMFGRVLYMKDDDTTKNLENISSKAEFELYMEDLGGIVSEASVSGTEYVCGVFTDKDYVLEEYGTSNMEFYIVTAVIATILVFGCILIEFAGSIHLVDCIAIENGGNDNLTVFQPRHIEAVLLVVVLLVVC